MADINLIDSLESVSLHLSSIEELAVAVTELPQLHTLHPFSFVLAFSLLAQAAMKTLGDAIGEVRDLESFQKDMRSLARAAK
ncbi:hypothetical protein [Pandoraea fibrosis]|uniref:Uncharacterized protein n=1 Tax=Pandoraea fibrosis TaxID=1891094 RepID=A0A5E4Z4I5_9BURK|nr:hypothetical protein [Pandoraea fibrosis]VVE55588.1 hypothetical protein PFI31113_04991 [Pandoraea fibrosis]